VTEARSLVAPAERDAIDAALQLVCDRYLGDLTGPVFDAIRYSLMGEGKRLRGRLLLEGYGAAGGGGDASELAAAVEVVHAYSLVHDDLPCMDDDDMRRGRPTVHRVYGVRAATAAGLAMVPLAARCAFNAAATLGLASGVSSRIVAELMRAAGAGGMIGGQLLDLEGEGTALDLAQLERIHHAKTGQLIRASVRLGGLAAGASEERITALDRYGECIGLAFQIADDLLDVTATSDQIGKTAGRDRALQKSTYPALLGVEGSRSRAEGLVEDGCSALRSADLLTPALERLARYTVERRS
jgi:farnesyl diphosphate synthase/geranylgeranyl diphosphate synthase type II